MGVDFIFLLLIALTKSEGAEEKKGPYRTMMTSITNCENTTLPVISKNPGISYNLKVVNTTTGTALVGNIGVTRNVKIISALASAYKWQLDRWERHLVLPRLTCQSPVWVTVISMMTNLKFDAVECVIMKGTYQLEFDINTADHIWSPEREYGRMRWRIEFMNKKNTIACFNADNVVEPIKNGDGA